MTQSSNNHADTMMTALSFDVGLKRTGVAVGQSIRLSASPVCQLKVINGKHDWREIDQLMVDWLPNIIIIGNPFMGSDNIDHALQKAINRLKSHIQQRHKIPIIDVDERLTSASANQELSSHSIKTKQKMRDQIAACLILEAYFSERKSKLSLNI